MSPGLTRRPRRLLSSAGLAVLLLAPGAAGCVALPTPEAARSARLEELSFTAIGQELGALRAGDPDGRRVIYVHGSPGQAEAWTDFLVPPIPGTDSVALDRPGFGRSDRGSVPQLRLQAEAVAALLVERQGRWPILVGHSLGGPIVAQVAIDHPQQVGGLVIVAGSMDPRLEPRQWFNYVARGLGWALPAALRRSNQEIWNLRRELQALEPRLHEIGCPVVIVHGREDGLVPFANVEFLRRHLTGAESVEPLTFEEAGHFLLWVEPTRSALRAAIERLVRGSASSPQTIATRNSRRNGYSVRPLGSGG